MRSLSTIVIVFATFVTIPSLCAAEGTHDGIIVQVASGTGKDEKDALKQALSNAIQTAVGTIVDAETVIKNDQIIREQILTASNAIVTKYDMIGTPRVENGLTTVTIKAQVEKKVLTERLAKASGNTIDVRGQDLFAQAVTELEKEKDAAKIVRRIFQDFPGNVLAADVVGQPRIIEKKDNKVEIAVGVHLHYDLKKYDQWVSSFLPLLEKIADQKVDVRWDWDQSTRVGTNDVEFPDFKECMIVPEKREERPRNTNGWMLKEDAEASYMKTIIPQWIVPKELANRNAIAVFRKQGNCGVTYLALSAEAFSEGIRASWASTIVKVSLKDKSRMELIGSEIVNGRYYARPDREEDPNGKYGTVLSPFFHVAPRYLRPLPAPLLRADGKTIPADRHLWVWPYFGFGDESYSGFCHDFHFTLSLDDVQKIKTIDVKIRSYGQLVEQKK